MKLGLYRYNIPFLAPIKLSKIPLESREGLLIYKDGGWGEICPLVGFSKETIDEAEDEALTYIKHLKNGISYEPTLPCVLHGVDCMNAKFNYDLKEYDSFPPNYTFLLGTPREITYNWYQLLDNHPPIIKLKVGRASLKDELKMIKEICRRTPEIRIILDPNGLWSREEALAMMSFLNPDNIEYIEDPCNNIDDCDYVSRKTGIPIALDHLLRTCPTNAWGDFTNLKAILIKPSLIGDQKACATYAKEAKKHQIRVVASSSFETQLGNYNIRMVAKQHLGTNNYHGLDTNKYFKYSIFKPHSLEVNTALLSTVFEYED